MFSTKLYRGPEVLKMHKHLGQNPFENDFRNNSKKHLELFFKQGNASSTPTPKTQKCIDKKKQQPSKLQTISKSEEKRVHEYLTKNGISTTLDISTALGIYVYDVIRILQSLESKGMVLKASKTKRTLF